MKIGDYVRTKNGMIAKIINQLEVGGGLHTEEYVFKLDNGNRLAIHSCKVIKSSPNIIDLIEVGDYVNGQKVVGKFYDELNNCYYLHLEIGEVYGKYARTYEQHIKSIITHEQIEQMEYKL